MRKYYFGILIVIILVLSSILYKEKKWANRPLLSSFPVGDFIEASDIDDEPMLYLFVFFSKNNCPENMEVIKSLSRMPNQFSVIGLVPPSELYDEKALRKISGATFPLQAIRKKHMNYLPFYTPAVYGVDRYGRILFFIPGVPNINEYFENFIYEFYMKAMNLLR